MVCDHLRGSCLKLPDLSFSLGFSALIFTPNNFKVPVAVISSLATWLLVVSIK